jgi:hypothetical protein
MCVTSQHPAIWRGHQDLSFPGILRSAKIIHGHTGHGLFQSLTEEGSGSSADRACGERWFWALPKTNRLIVDRIAVPPQWMSIL